MPVSSLVVQTDSSNLDLVREAIDKLDGARVTNVEGLNLVTITETRSSEEDKALWDKLEEIPGVLSLNLIYHNFEDAEEGSDA